MAGPAMAAEKDPPTLVTSEEAPTAVLMPVSVTRFAVPRRPAALPALYVMFTALQIADAWSTVGAVEHGAQEINPLLTRGNSATILAVKAVSTASTIYFAERLWKKNRFAAIVVMAGINGSYAAIAAHNMKRGR